MIKNNKLTYIANAGVVLDINDKKIMIDGFARTAKHFYKSTPVSIKEQLIDAVPPYDNIDLMLITHHHSDHFDHGSIVEYLKKNPSTTVVSTVDVISQIKNNLLEAEAFNLIGLNPPLHRGRTIVVNGIKLTGFLMLHDGEDYRDIKNLAFLIDLGVNVLCLGDSAPIKENYISTNFKQYNIDYLIANFPYAGIPSARQIIRNYIEPQKILIVHFPYEENDRFGYIKGTKKSYNRTKDNFIETIFLENLGEGITL